MTRLPALPRHIVTSYLTIVALSNGAGAQTASRQLSFQAGANRPLDLTADGSALAYVTVPADRYLVDSDSAVVWVKALPDGAAVQLPGKAPFDEEVQLRWSPDGSRLAYLAVADGAMRLHVWHRRSGQSQVFSARIACTTECRQYELQWAPDSRTVYYLAEREDVRAAAPETYTWFGVDHRRRVQLLFRDEEHAGVSVRESPPTGEEARYGQFLPPPPVDVVAGVVSDGTVLPVFTGKAARQLFLSPDGRTLLVATAGGAEGRVRQLYADYYLVSVPSAERPRVLRAVLSPAPALSKVKQWFGQLSWSPTSDRIAFAEHGALAAGDVFVMDVATHQVRNLTASLTLPPGGDDTALGDPATIATRGFNYQGKFGNLEQPPIWSRDGRRLYVVRIAAKRESWRSELWTLDAFTGAATRHPANDVGSVNCVLQQNGIALGGRAPDETVLAVRFAGDSEGGFLGATADDRRIATRARFRGQGTRRWSNVAPAGHVPLVAVTDERSDAPPEIAIVDLRTGRMTPGTAMNAAFHPHAYGERRLLRWTTAHGDTLGAWLQLPATRARLGRGAKLPLIMEVYGGDEPSRRPTVYDPPGLYLPPLRELLDSGYAILSPDLPFNGSGRACVEVTGRAIEALDAASGTGLVDADRVAVIGASFGGWTVNCLLTQTSRFRAGVSVAGISDFITDYVSVWPFARTGDGGQQRASGALWDVPEQYVADSPIFGLAKVTTPLLLVHGKEDDIVPFEQSVEMFYGLTRLGKTVTLVGYDGRNHFNVLGHADYHGRVIRWIEGHLTPS